MSENSLIEAVGIAKNFKFGGEAVSVLKSVNVAVRGSEIIGILGASGSGKTTFLSILGCMLKPCDGHLTINGELVLEHDFGRIRKKYINFIFQDINLISCLSALENVEYGLNLKGVKGRAARSMAEEMLNEVGLSDRRNYLPGQLSRGQRQRVAIARALAPGNPILLADEPTASLDPDAGVLIVDLLEKITKKFGRTLVIVTHDRTVCRITDRVFRLCDGALMEDCKN